MANPEHLAILKQGVEQWNAWGNEHRDVQPQLSGTDLSDVNLAGASLIKADLREAKLSHAKLDGADLTAANLGGADLVEARLLQTNLLAADLTNANLSKANLNGVSLRRAKIAGADLHGASLASTFVIRVGLAVGKAYPADLGESDLTGANLSEASLTGINLKRANLDSTNFSGAQISGVQFDDVDLSTAKGLETARHDGPSTIGVDTIYKSRGKIPEVFLRGCGVPDEFITYIGSMVGRPIVYYSCFISYSTHDQEFAEWLHADLQAKGVRCWFAPHDIRGGRKIHEQIDEAIRLHDRLLLILSEDSMSSEWVNTEIAKARKRETRESNRVLFPVRLVGFERLRDWECFDGDTGKDSAREIREYFVPDFSNWKDHDSYQTAFQRLVSNLKAEASE